MTDAIVIEDLKKRLGKTQALDGVHLTAAQGTIVALLGPNGAGKTTTVRVLSTLLTPDAGRASVCGWDVAKYPHRVRPLIALTGQFTAVDVVLTGRENLELMARLARLDKVARRRIPDLLDRFGLAEAAGNPVKTYSSGMRRRLDLASSLLTEPAVLILDEPTTGLDLQARLQIWAEIRSLVHDGTTLLLTTQYLEEADQLADAITVIDHGRVVAQGTPAALKDQVGGDRLEITLADPTQMDRATETVRGRGDGEPTADRATATLVLALKGDVTGLPEILRDLDRAGVQVGDFTVRRSTLDDVFLELVGTRPGESSATANGADTGGADRRARRKRFARSAKGAK